MTAAERRTARMAPLSTRMAAVLEWLFAYPAVELIDYRHGRVVWSHWWANDAARRHVGAVVAHLGREDPVLPRAAPLDGPTPRCGRATFDALRARGLIIAYRYQVASGVPTAYHYQISRQGIARAIALDAAPAEPHEGTNA